MIKNLTITEKLSLLCLYFAAAIRLDESLNVIALYFAIPLSFVLSFVSVKGLLCNKYLKLFIILCLWICLSYLGAEYIEAANRQMKQILGVVLLCVTIANLSRKEKLIPYLYFIYIILFVAAYKYALDHVLDSNFDFSEDRLNDDKLNANTLAYYLFFNTVALFFGGEFFSKKRCSMFFKLLFICVIPVSFLTAILTGSRQVLVIQIPIILFFLAFRYVKVNVKSIIYLFFLLLGSFILYNTVGAKFYENSYLKYRYEMNIKDDERFYLLNRAIEVGMENPLFGVGPGNYLYYNQVKGFSHCTYTELFANTGVVGLVLYMMLIFVFMRRQWLRFRFYKDKMFIAFFFIGIIFILDNMFYVFYTNLWLMSFFILIASHSEVYYKRLIR